MTPEQWRNNEHEHMTTAQRANLGLAWAEELCLWLERRGYVLRESGSYNPATGRGWYGEPCEYQKGHLRVDFTPGGIMILRDPGAGIQITRMASGTHGMMEHVTPNAQRLDHPNVNCDSMQRQIERFESRAAYTIEEAWLHFFGEPPPQQHYIRRGAEPLT